jgi:hypothetical protein
MRRLASMHQARRKNLEGSRPEPPKRPAHETRSRAPMTCCFGATRVGPLLARVRLHLATERFLAQLRKDVLWEAACDYSAMTLAYMGSQLARGGRGEPLPRSMPVAPIPPADSR